MRGLTEEEDRLLWEALRRSSDTVEEIEPADPRRDCPWKCLPGRRDCLCACADGQGALK